MKRHEDARRDGGRDGKRNGPIAFSGVPAFCGGHLRVLRLPWAAASQRSPQVHSLVVLPVSPRRHWHRLGDVPVFAVSEIRASICEKFKQLIFRAELTDTFCGCYRKNTGRGSSVVEQPIRNRQVVGSTPTLGSKIRSTIPLNVLHLHKRLLPCVDRLLRFCCMIVA